MKIVRMATNGLAARCFILPELQLLIQEGHEIIIISNPDEILKKETEGKKVTYYPLPLKRNISPLTDFFTLIRLIVLFRKIKPDVVHTITPKAGLLGMIASKIAGVNKRIHDYVGMVQETRSGISRSILNITDKITCSLASKIFANSHSLIKKIQEYDLADSGKINIIHKGSSYGVNIKLFNREKVTEASLSEIKRLIGYVPSHKYILFAGRLVKDKGIEELVNAFLALHKKFPEVKLLLIGDFEPRLDAISENAENIIRNHPGIQVIPWTNKIRDFIYLADFLVLPTYREGFANILLEAGAMKCPVICSNATGNIDLIRNGENGFMFPVADSEALFYTMQEAITHPEMMKSMAETLYVEIIRDFDLEKIIRLNLKKYD